MSKPFAKPIVITGGAQRLGLAVALDLKQAGHEVIVTYRSERPGLAQLREAGIHCRHADFASEQGVADFIGFLRESCDSIRALIHNASDWGKERSAERYDSPEAAADNLVLMQQMMQIHVTTPYRINLACGDLLKACPDGADIIHFTDDVVRTGSKKHLAYVASKAALDSLTMSFAQLYAPEVKVNSIAPALILFNEGDNEEYQKKVLAKSLLQNEGGTQEVVNCVNHLLSSHYITAQIHYLNGGRNLV